MSVRTEKEGAVWTIIHDRPEARNAMDPESADALTAAFLEFDADKTAAVAVFYGAGGAFCAGWDLKYVSTLNAAYPLGELDIPVAGPRTNGGEIPRGPLGPSRLELDKPVIAAIEGPAVAGGMELGLWCDFRVMAKEFVLRRLLPPMGSAADRRRNRAAAANRRPRPRAGDHSHRTESSGRRVPEHRLVRIRHAQGRGPREGGRAGAPDRAFPAGLCPRGSALGHQEPRAERARGTDSGVVQRSRSIDQRRCGGRKPLQGWPWSAWRLRQDPMTRDFCLGSKAEKLNASICFPLFTQQRTFTDTTAMSEKCYFRTHAPQQGRAYSIASSARARRDEGIFTPSDLAVLRLMMSVYLSDCSMGRSAGLAPFKIRST